jgi:plasmid maintenance system antidote protein VapI
MKTKTITGKKIRAVMGFKEITGAELARKIKVHRTAINKVVDGSRRSPRLRKHISRALNLPMNIWNEMDKELSSERKNS